MSDRLIWKQTGPGSAANAPRSPRQQPSIERSTTVSDTVPAPKGAAKPTPASSVWHPADPGRWAALNLADPDPSGLPPRGATISDYLLWALASEGAADPIEGIIDGVRTELLGLADLAGNTPASALFRLLERRLGIACTLLGFTDERMPMPLEPEDTEPPAAVEASASPAAPTATNDGGEQPANLDEAQP